MLKKVKIPRPADFLGGALFDAFFGPGKTEGELEFPDTPDADKITELKEDLVGMFTVSKKMDEMVELWKETNKLLIESNSLMRDLLKNLGGS